MQLWTPGTAVAAGSTVFAREADVDALVEEVFILGIEPRPRVFTLTPRAEAWPLLVPVLAELDRFETFTRHPASGTQIASALASVHADLQPIVTAAIDVVASVRRCDDIASLQAIERLEHVLFDASCVPEASRKWSKKLLVHLAELVRKGLVPLRHPAVYEVAVAHEKWKNWWEYRPTLADAFKQLSTRFNATVNGDPPSDLLEIRAWIDGCETSLGLLELKAGTEADSFGYASALFAATGRHFKEYGRLVVGLMAFHRAMEWHMASKCAAQGLLNFSLKYGARIGHEHVTFSTLLTLAVNNGLLAHTYVSDFDELNTWRNQLPYTHHLTTPARSKLAILCDRAEQHMLALNTANAWRKVHSALSVELPLTIGHLLDAGRNLRDSIKLLPSERFITQGA